MDFFWLVWRLLISKDKYLQKILIVYLIYLVLNVISIYYLGDSLLIQVLDLTGADIYNMVPGVRCPTCAANGEESIVIRGRNCPRCGTECN